MMSDPGDTVGPMSGGTGHHSGMGFGSVDEADYLTTMVAHHLDAIVAARQLARSPTPAMRRFGRQIVRDQSRQVRQMNRWLDRWHPDATVSDYEPMMGDLSALAGRDLDREFLEQMIPHHMIAVMASHRLLHHGARLHRVVTGLAYAIIDQQTAEIVWMRRRLTETDR